MQLKLEQSFLLIAITSLAGSVFAKYPGTQLVTRAVQNGTAITLPDHTTETVADGVSGASDVGPVKNGTGLPNSLLSDENNQDTLTRTNSSDSSTLSDLSGVTLGLSQDDVNALSNDSTQTDSTSTDKSTTDKSTTDKSGSDKSGSDSKGKDGDKKSSASTTHVSLAALITALFCAFVGAGMS